VSTGKRRSNRPVLRQKHFQSCEAALHNPQFRFVVRHGDFRQRVSLHWRFGLELYPTLLWQSNAYPPQSTQQCLRLQSP